MVRASVADLQLPVPDPEHINCWENIELSLLKLEDAQFDIIYKDRLKEIRDNEIKTMSEEAKAKAIKSRKLEDKLDKLPQGALDDPFIREMEKTLAQGDEKSVKEMLKSFKM